MQPCRMTTVVPISKRGAVTLPPALRRKFGFGSGDNPLVVIEERDGEIILRPATAVVARDIPAQVIQSWRRRTKGACGSLSPSRLLHDSFFGHQCPFSGLRFRNRRGALYLRPRSRAGLNSTHRKLLYQGGNCHIPGNL
ncbi:MAG: hypothetical protein EOP86_28470 [Verrucomicrobiaceae bacterium]|nr:MAG: hypothetical protein EOP86_28470 [Verrucomicrobiaceae bacterium]